MCLPKNWKYLRGDIYFADMEPHIGSEQGGMRPVVVLQNDVGNRYAPTLDAQGGNSMVAGHLQEKTTSITSF